MKILIVEDNRIIRESVKEGLKSSGYHVDESGLGKEGIEKALVNEYDLLILDLNLPDTDGIEICKRVREVDPNVPILALTARDTLKDKLRGFENGFDDYLTKPFEFEELLARVAALIRRAKPSKKLVYEIQNLKVEPEKRKVLQNSKEIKLSKIEFNILEYLLRHKGIVVKNEELIEHIWNEDKDLLDPPIRSHIKNLRKKIGDNEFTIVETIPGVGYRIS